MPVTEDKEKILQEINKKLTGTSKIVESLFLLTKKEQENNSIEIAIQEETQSENKKNINEEKTYRIKTTKLLEEIKDKEISSNSSNPPGLGSLLAGLGGLGSLLAGLGGLGLVIGGLTGVITELTNWFKGEGTDIKDKGALEAGKGGAAAIGATSRGARAISPSRMVKNFITGKSILTPSKDTIYAKQATTEAKTAITGVKQPGAIGTEPKATGVKQPGAIGTEPKATGVKQPGAIGTEPKATVSERISAGKKATTASVKFGAVTGLQAGRTAGIGGLITGGTVGAMSLFDENLSWSERLQQAGGAFGKGALTAGLIDLGMTTTSSAFSAAGLSGLARAVPIAGWLYGVGDLLYRSYAASDWARSIAENEMIESGTKNIKQTQEQVDVMGQDALRLMNEGKENEAKVIEDRAVKLIENAQKNLFAIHNVVKTHQKLDEVVDIDLAWGKGQKYSIQDVNYLIETFKEAKDLNNANEFYSYYNKKGADEKTNSILKSMGHDNVFALIKSGPEILKDYNTNLWARPQEYYEKYKSDFIDVEREEGIKRMKRESAGSRSVITGPKFANEGIIKGSPSGSSIIAGENRTSEAVVSTKPNTVTESIGNNIYNIIKEKANTDITTTQKEAIMMNSVLNKIIQEYNDVYKISPIIGSSSNSASPTIVNNFVGGMSSGNLQETNASFNQQGLVASNTETILQRVYLESYKAALL